MKIKTHIPNVITCCNLVCGCLAIVQAFNGSLINAAYLVGLAGVFDFFDGFAARMLRVTSPIGKDLDSLADMVTFGVVPGIVMHKLLAIGFFNEIFSPNESAPAALRYTPELLQSQALISYIPFVIIIFSAIRLAKFNNDTRQTTSFIGLPTPANAILICSFPLILAYGNSGLASDIIENPYFLIIASVVLSVFLVAEIPLFALKFRTFSWSGNRTRYIFLMASLALVIMFRFTGIPLIILLYVLMSINSNYFAKRKERH